ncbi:hypothetical protein ACLOJK_017335 [Asimina triloba]
MNALKATQAFPPAVSFCLQPAKLPKWNKSTIVCCRSSSSSDGTESEPAGDGGGGDKRKQELLAKIAMLQAEKVRVTEFLDERSAYLTKFAEDANKEFDAVGEDALKELYEAEAEIMENMENRMRTFEESTETARQEIEKNDQILKDFEDKIEKDRNEGLFFKNLRERKPQDQAKVQEEAQKLRELTKANAESKVRRNIYLALICLLAATIVNSIISSPELEWQKIASLGLILVALVAQLKKVLVIPMEQQGCFWCNEEEKELPSSEETMP